MQTAFIETSDGAFTAYFSENGLARLDFPSTNRPPADGQTPDVNGNLISQWLALTQRALEQACRGQGPEEMPPFDLAAGTDFQRRVWLDLCRIPAGRTKTYAEVARSIGSPKAMRAVGQACGANPIPVLIPCHRVVAAQGGLGGFSGPPLWKVKLLSREGVLLKSV